MSIEEFRKEILSALLEKTNTKGEPRFDEASAKELLNQLMSWKKESYSIHPKMWLMYCQKSVGYKSIEAFSFLF